jgi:phospholipid/cholesterol/gamma-HCH transport system substrate-binding protein
MMAMRMRVLAARFPAPLRDFDAGFLRNAADASTRLPPLLQSGNDAVRSLQTQILPEAQRTLVRLDHLSTSLDETGDRIRRNPSVLLRGTGTAPLGPGEAP